MATVPRALFLVPLLLAGCGEPTPSVPRGPNVLLISIDMLRRDHVSCYGYERATTPTLDRLAAQGARFEQHVTSAPWTLPAHAALFSSLPDSVHGCVDGADNALAPSIVTLAERFRAAGYRTAGYHAGPYLHAAFGLGQGFEDYRYTEEASTQLAAEDAARWAGDPVAQRRSHHGVTNPHVTEAARAFLRGRDPDAPFFLFVHLWDAHFDFVPPPPYDAAFTDPDYDGFVTGREFFFDPRIAKDMDASDLAQLLALYDGEILWTDHHVALLLEELERLGLDEDTVVMVTSDHGTEFFDHGRKGHRQTLYDEVLRVPLVLRAPGRVEPGSVVPQQTRIVDLGPTLLDLCGLPVPDDVVGVSLVPLLHGDASAAPSGALSELLADGNALRSWRRPEGKVVRNEHNGAAAYHDLVADPHEDRPVAVDADHGAELDAALSRMRQGLQALRQRFPGAVPMHVPPGVGEAIHASGYGGGADQDGSDSGGSEQGGSDAAEGAGG